MKTKLEIHTHWDPHALITVDSDALTEYNLWREHAAQNPGDWSGDEFAIEDFAYYIDTLRIHA